MKKKKKTPREQAIDFIATYDTPDAGPYEKHIVRIARTWLSLTRGRRTVQGIINRIVEEFSQPTPDGYGCGWDELKTQFTAWAIEEEWIDPVSPPSVGSRGRSAPAQNR